MNYKDNIEWLKSLKQQIGQAQHRDLWHFELAIDETIANLKPLANPHGRLIDAEKLLIALTNDSHGLSAEQVITIMEFPTIINAEVSE